MDIGIIGSGIVAQTLGGKLAELGHSVTISSRDTSRAHQMSWGTVPSADDWVAEQGALRAVEAADFAGAATRGADLVINATEGVHSLEALQAAGSADLAGKILMDVANPLVLSQGMPPRIAFCNESLGVRIQEAFPEARVVKTLNTVTAAVMVAPGQLPEETDGSVRRRQRRRRQGLGRARYSAGGIWLDERRRSRRHHGRARRGDVPARCGSRSSAPRARRCSTSRSSRRRRVSRSLRAAASPAATPPREPSGVSDWPSSQAALRSESSSLTGCGGDEAPGGAMLVTDAGSPSGRERRSRAHAVKPTMNSASRDQPVPTQSAVDQPSDAMPGRGCVPGTRFADGCGTVAPLWAVCRAIRTLGGSVPPPTLERRPPALPVRPSPGRTTKEPADPLRARAACGPWSSCPHPRAPAMPSGAAARRPGALIGRRVYPPPPPPQATWPRGSPPLTVSARGQYSSGGVAAGASSRGPRVSDTAAPSRARTAPVYMASE